mmetsp:Transcript_46477/g.95047  ORF Transcript_46477/g.95047 Transcript_46477/m.95047 type:complete len:221 (-) Transcript_46477:2013-2675(-)
MQRYSSRMEPTAFSPSGESSSCLEGRGLSSSSLSSSLSSASSDAPSFSSSSSSSLSSSSLSSSSLSLPINAANPPRLGIATLPPGFAFPPPFCPPFCGVVGAATSCFLPLEFCCLPFTAVVTCDQPSSSTLASAFLFPPPPFFLSSRPPCFLFLFSGSFFFSVYRFSLSTSFCTSPSICGPAAARRGTHPFDRMSLRSRSMNRKRADNFSSPASSSILAK